jgi:hypothetical protein
MNQTLSNEALARRGDCATKLLNDPLLTETLDALERDCFTAFCKTRDAHHLRDEG